MVNSDFKRTYDDPFMKAFDKELKEIQKQVVNAERHKSIIECVPKNKNNKIIKRRLQGLLQEVLRKEKGNMLT